MPGANSMRARSQNRARKILLAPGRRRVARVTACLIVACTLTASSAALAQTTQTWMTQVLMAGGQKVRVTPIPGFNLPWGITFLPNGDALVSEKNKSTLRLIHDSALDPIPITGLPPILQDIARTRGGVDVLVDPHYAQNHWIYFAYQQPMAGKPNVARAVLGRARYDGGHQLSEVEDVFVSDAWNTDAVATRIAFGQDGKIYMVIGTTFVNTFSSPPSEYGTNLDAQDPTKDAGKVLRLNSDGSIPKDNPFAGNPKYKPEIYALGIRNSMGIFPEPGTGKLWLTDNGPRGGDEINLIKPGLNYGWPLVTYGRAYAFDPDGKRTANNIPTAVQPPAQAPGMEEPFLFWVPSPSASGIVVYNGDKFPAWKNSILVGELKFKRVERITLTRQGVDNDRIPMLAELDHRIRQIMLGPDGLLYLLTDETNGAVLKLEPADTATPLTLH